MIPVYKRREAMRCATTNRHLGLSATKKWDTKEDKGKSMMHALYALYALWYAKRHVSERSDVKP